MTRKYNYTTNRALPIFAGTLLLTFLSLPFINDLVILDEAIFAQTFRSFAETGSFTYYAGITRGWQNGLWHPPTYVIYASVWSGFFGASSTVFRVATFLFSLLTVPLVGILASNLYEYSSRSGSKSWATTGAILLYVTSPLVVQNSTLIDIDGSLLALVVTGFVIWTVVAFEKDRNDGLTLYLGIVAWFAVISWIKFGALPVLLACVFAYAYLKWGIRRSIFVSAAAVTGFGVFTLSWWIVARTFNFSFSTPFLHNFGSLLEGGSHIQTKKRLLLSAWGAYVEVLWISPFLGLLAIYETIRGRVPTQKSFRRSLESRAPYLFCTAIALLTLVQYAILAKVPYGFPKYLGIAMPLLCSVAATAIPPVATAIETRQDKVRVITLTAISVAVLLIAGDPFLVSFNDGYMAVIHRSVITVLGFAGAILVVGGLLRLWNPNHDRKHLVALGLLVLLLGSNFGILAVQMTSEYSTRYNYGQRGTEAAIDATQTAYTSITTEQRAEAVVPRDFGFYLDGEFQIVREYSVSELKRQQPPLIVLRTRKYYAVKSPIYQELRSSSDYELRQYGSYAVFVKDG